MFVCRRSPFVPDAVSGHGFPVLSRPACSSARWLEPHADRLLSAWGTIAHLCTACWETGIIFASFFHTRRASVNVISACLVVFPPCCRCGTPLIQRWMSVLCWIGSVVWVSTCGSCYLPLPLWLMPWPDMKLPSRWVSHWFFSLNFMANLWNSCTSHCRNICLGFRRGRQVCLCAFAFLYGSRANGHGGEGRV